MAQKDKPVTAEGAESAGTTPVGDHTTRQLAAESNYRDNPDKPAEESVAQVQDVPKGWPGTTSAQREENAGE